MTLFGLRARLREIAVVLVGSKHFVIVGGGIAGLAYYKSGSVKARLAVKGIQEINSRRILRVANLHGGQDV